MRNYTLKTYVKNKEKYGVLEHVIGKPDYNGKTIDIDELTFAEVKFVMKGLGEISTWDSIKEIFKNCFSWDKQLEDDLINNKNRIFSAKESKVKKRHDKSLDKWFWSGKVVEFFEARNFIIAEFKKLIEQEQKMLSSVDPVNSLLWKQAGGDKLNRFGGILPLNQLGKLYGQFPFDLQNRKYMEIFLLLTIEKESGEIQTKFSKLKAQTNKK